MKSKNKLRPVTMNEVVGGQHYLIVYVDLVSGKMELERRRLCGQPFKRDGDWYFRTEKKLPSIDPFIDLRWPLIGAETAGLVVYPDYFQISRTFRYSPRNEAILSSIVKRQAGEEYLELLDLDNEEVLYLFEALEFEYALLLSAESSFARYETRSSRRKASIH